MVVWYALIISLFSIKKKKKLFEQDFIFVNDLLLELDTTNSFTIISNKISKINYLIWAGLRHSVPKHHVKNSNCLRSEISLILTIDNKEFDILEKKCKGFDWANVIFATCISYWEVVARMLVFRGLLLFLVGIICPLKQERSLWPPFEM